MKRKTNRNHSKKKNRNRPTHTFKFRNRTKKQKICLSRGACNINLVMDGKYKMHCVIIHLRYNLPYHTFTQRQQRTILFHEFRIHFNHLRNFCIFSLFHFFFYCLWAKCTTTCTNEINVSETH